MNTSDLQFKKLRALGYEGSLADMLAQFKADNAPWPGWDVFLASEGYTSGSVAERKYRYFTDLAPVP